MKRSAWLSATLALVLSPVCAKSDPRDPVTSVSADDAQMNAAIDRARRTTGRFIAALRSPKRSQSGFSVKMRITDGDAVEHFWLTGVSFDGTAFHGVIDNDPDAVKNVTAGEAERVRPAEISDWMYIDHGILVGGYTLRVLRDRMSPADRAEFDKSVPFKIDETAP